LLLAPLGVLSGLCDCDVFSSFLVVFVVLSRYTVAAFVSSMSWDDVWIITGPKSLAVDMSFDVANVRG